MLNTIIFDQQTIRPSKIVCVGRNYVEHIQELNNQIPDEMVIFLKPNSAISENLISYHTEPLHYEGELCFLYQDGGLCGVGLGLDLTKRQLQSRLKEKGLPWERAKAFDGSAVFSSFVNLEGDLNSLSFQLLINGQIVQQGSTPLMMVQPEKILDEIQSIMSLQDGDIIMTGTPKGVGLINSGDHFEALLYQSEKLLVQAEWMAK